MEEEKRLYIKKISKKDNLIKKDRNFKVNFLSFIELKDIKGILEFIDLCRTINNFEYSSDDIEDMMVDNDNISYIIYDNDSAVGFIISHINSEQLNYKILEIDNIGILDEYKNNKYKNSIINEIINKAWDLNVDMIKVSIKDDFILNSLEKMSFVKSE